MLTACAAQPLTRLNPRCKDVRAPSPGPNRRPRWTGHRLSIC